LTDHQSQCDFDVDFASSVQFRAVTNNSGRSTRTSKQGDGQGKFVVEEELEEGLWRLNV
jgi:hypothetical protein